MREGNTMTLEEAEYIYPYESEERWCRNTYESIIKNMKRIPEYSIDYPMLDKAYEAAKFYHGNTRRYSGELYLRHPLAVMEELSKQLCKTSILAAALLHDTLEDCRDRGATYPALRENFSYEIAEIVESVTAIKAEEKLNNPRFPFMTTEEKKLFLDAKTDAKLISSSFQREAFLVRFSDRAHNLATLQHCAPHKRKMKISSTRDFLIPAADKLEMRYFSILLNDLCMSQEGDDPEQNRHHMLINKRNTLIHASGNIHSSYDQILSNALQSQSIFSFPAFNPFSRFRTIKRDGEKNSIKTIQRRVLTAYEIHLQLGTDGVFERSKLDLWETILTCKDFAAARMIEHFISFFRTNLKPAGMFLEYVTENQNAVYFRLTDQFENNYRIVLIPESQLESYFIGNADGDRLTMIDDDSPSDALRPKITVYSYSPRKGYTKYHKRVPYGATALDFAFIIKPELAYTVKRAQIRTWESEQQTVPFTKADHYYPLWTTLNDGDVVYFDADYPPNAQSTDLSNEPNDPTDIGNVKIDWFGQINTEYAKKRLIEYYEMNIEFRKKPKDPHAARNTHDDN